MGILVYAHSPQIDSRYISNLTHEKSRDLIFGGLYARKDFTMPSK